MKRISWSSKVFLWFLCFVFSQIALANETSGKFQLRVLTYNIKGLPAIAGGYNNSFRFKAIGGILAQKVVQGSAPDIILLQESFVGETKALRDAAHYPYISMGPKQNDPDEFGRPTYKMLNGGLVIMSQDPILSQDKQAFGDSACATWDCYANKGVQAVSVRAKNAPFALTIFNTHLQANDDQCKIRLLQMQSVQRFIKRVTDWTEPMIFAGDFNVRKGIFSFDWWQTNSGLQNADQLCVDHNGCQVSATTDPGTFLSEVDHHYFRQGIAQGIDDNTEKYYVEIHPIYAEKNFTQLFNGETLSDHLGFQVTYEITWRLIQ